MALYRHGMVMKKAEKEDNSPGVKERMSGNNTAYAGLKKDWTRATFIVKKEHLEKVKAVAYWDRKKLKDVIADALESYLKNKTINTEKEN